MSKVESKYRRLLANSIIDHFLKHSLEVEEAETTNKKETDSK